MSTPTLNLAAVQRVHFIGIGGIGMSALARYFLHERKTVSGSDRAPSALTDALEREGVRFFPEQVPENLADGVDLVVYTEAMAADHPELVAARERGIPTRNYFAALALVANPYYLIAVAGTHGKTTTTAMLVDVFEEAGLDPTAVIGSLRTKTRSNFRAGKSTYCIVEACEYRRDFLHLEPDVLVITNLEAEHLDYYRDLADVQAAFGELARKVPEEGFIVCDPHDPNVAPVLADVRATVIGYPRLVDPLMELAVPGMHNLKNAAAALGVVEALAIDPAIARHALEHFAGTWRRSERIGETPEGALVFDDYAHHPTEIEVTVRAFRERYPEHRIVLAFQPHLHSRTKDFFEGFVAALALADEVVFAPVHEARTEVDTSAGSPELAAALGEKARVFGSYEEIVAYLREHTAAGDLILTMGAGAVYLVAEALVAETATNPRAV